MVDDRPATSVRGQARPSSTSSAQAACDGVAGREGLHDLDAERVVGLGVAVAASGTVTTTASGSSRGRGAGGADQRDR